MCAGKDSEITDSLTELRVYSFLISCLLAVLYTNLNRGQDTHSIDTQLYCTVQEDTGRARTVSVTPRQTQDRSQTNLKTNPTHRLTLQTTPGTQAPYSTCLSFRWIGT